MGRTALRAAVLGAVGLASAGARDASAATLLYEGFDYTVGESLHAKVNPGTSNPWLKVMAPAPTDGLGDRHVVVNSNLDYAGLPAATGNAVILPRTATTGHQVMRIDVPGRPYTRADDESVFASFTLRLDEIDAITDAQAANPTHRRGGFFAGFHGGQASTSTSASVHSGFAGELYMRRELDGSGVQTGRMELGITKNLHTLPGALTEPVFADSPSFAIDEVAFVVIEYDFNAGGSQDVMRMWVNPTPGELSLAATPSITTAVPSNDLAGTLNIESFYVRNDTNLPGDVIIDEVRLGASFADVSVVPEPAAVGLLALGAAAMAGRRRRPRRQGA